MPWIPQVIGKFDSVGQFFCPDHYARCIGTTKDAFADNGAVAGERCDVCGAVFEVCANVNGGRFRAWKTGNTIIYDFTAHVQVPNSSK